MFNKCMLLPGTLLSTGSEKGSDLEFLGVHSLRCDVSVHTDLLIDPQHNASISRICDVIVKSGKKDRSWETNILKLISQMTEAPILSLSFLICKLRLLDKINCIQLVSCQTKQFCKDS